jgi:hypothetical protein
MRTGKRTAHDWRVVDHHDEYEHRGYQRELFEENRQPICGVKIPEAGRLVGRRSWSDEEGGDENHREPRDCDEGQDPLVDFGSKRFEHQDHHPEHQNRDLKLWRCDHGYLLELR